MVEISLSGSGEGPGVGRPPAYSVIQRLLTQRPIEPFDVR
jgi:hypothetical protein